jgi:murein L,D-transpeptidase YcbB/YkuD
MAQTSTAAPSLLETVAERLRDRIEASAVVPSLEVEDEPIFSSDVLARFYLERSFRPAWIGPHGPLPLADELLGAIDEADREGLHPGDYHLLASRELMDQALAERADGRASEPHLLADLDIALTDAFLVYGAHLAVGRVHPETIDTMWRAQLREIDMVAVLEDALSRGAVRSSLEALLPRHTGYRKLREALARYRDFVARGGWPLVPPGAKLEKGASGERVRLLRARLAITGEVSEERASDTFEDGLDRAVRSFQRRNGLEADGVVGPRTLDALNHTAAERARQIEINLERWRWLPQDLGERHVLVNIPQFELDVVEGDRTVLAMRAVVGRPYRRTPVFTGLMTYLVLSPYWHVPPGIAAADIVPAVRKDTSYLAARNIKVFQGWGADSREVDPFTVDWSAVTGRNLPYHFRQEPGPANALGRVKFMFPNAYHVYLHDTPSRELFDRDRRAFSSGCIRIEKALDLAEYLLRDDRRWSRNAIEAAARRDRETTVLVPRPIPVHLLYWTSWADAEGTVHFREDIYERDARLADALAEPPPTIKSLSRNRPVTNP